jgi:hypothetical protein
VAPPLSWPDALPPAPLDVEGLISRKAGEGPLSILESAPVRERRRRRLGRETWWIVDELGWAKKYDAEYLALASLLDTKVATLVRRFRRAAERLGLSAGFPPTVTVSV